MSTHEYEEPEFCQYASPPCFLHELQPEYQPERQDKKAADVPATWPEIARWRKAAGADSGFAVPPDEIRAARKFVHAEAAALALIPLLAAFIPRIYGI